MGVIFDGRKFAEKLSKRLNDEAIKFNEKNGRRPKLASIYDPEHVPSKIYTNIKAKKAEEVGILFEKYSIVEFKHQLHELVPMLNADKSVDGIIVQTPFEGDQEMIDMLDPKKDVDGLRENSLYLQATVRAVVEILNSKIILACEQNPNDKFVVVGSGGMVGHGLMDYFHKQDINNLIGLDSSNFDEEKLRNADVVISAVGVAGLIQPEMVKDGVVAIDVGYPQGDFDPLVAEKASFFTPVPGGVGPVTVVSLFANLLKI